MASTLYTRILAVAFLAFAAIPAPSSAAQAGSMRGAAPSDSVDTGAIETSLRAALESVSNSGSRTAQRLAKIEASVWRTFQALPKNSIGRLAPRAVRYIVHAYFAKENGWLIRGLDPHGMQVNVTEIHEVSILQDRVPALVEALLEVRRSDHGLSLDDCVVMIAVLERLIFDESTALLQSAYALNGLSPSDLVNDGELHEILRSYLIVFQMGMKSNLSDMKGHLNLKKRLARRSSSWPMLTEFEEDAANNFFYAHQDQMNPFTMREFPFEVAAHIVDDLAQDYGKWQNTECRQMQEELTNLDVDGNGLVPLSRFWGQPEQAVYQFSESLEYLRTIGALDESVTSDPHVRIANYLTGPSNCIASSAYYSVCCLSECEGIMNDLEGKIQGPLASPGQLLALVSNISSSSVDAPRELPQALQDRLHGVAERHDGSVPLHGRLFAQWLHHAFPRECPYPHVVDSSAVLTPGHWSAENRTNVAPKDERRRHVEESQNRTGQEEPAEEPQDLQWSDHEVLVLAEPSATGSAALRGVARAAVQLAMLLAVARVALAGCHAASGASGSGGKDKEKGLALPM